MKNVSFALSQSKHIQHSLAFIPLLEFRITDGGTKIWELPDGRDRRLTVQTRNGHTFTITRRYRGGLCFSANFSQSKSNMTKLVQLIQFILSSRLLFKHQWILEKGTGTYILLLNLKVSAICKYKTQFIHKWISIFIHSYNVLNILVPFLPIQT